MKIEPIAATDNINALRDQYIPFIQDIPNDCIMVDEDLMAKLIGIGCMLDMMARKG